MKNMNSDIVVGEVKGEEAMKGLDFNKLTNFAGEPRCDMTFHCENERIAEKMQEIINKKENYVVSGGTAGGMTTKNFNK